MVMQGRWLIELYLVVRVVSRDELRRNAEMEASTKFVTLCTARDGSEECQFPFVLNMRIYPIQLLSDAP